MRSEKPWADEIAEITGRLEYQTCTVRIQDFVGAPGEDNWETGGRDGADTPVLIYEGQARVIGVRSAVTMEGVDQSNATALTSVRLQLPQRSVANLANGQYVRVLSAPQNPSLERYVYKVNSDFQGSSAATRTFEIGVDLDSEWSV